MPGVGVNEKMILFIAITTTTSPAPSGAPIASRFTPGADKSNPLYLVSTLLESSFSLPCGGPEPYRGHPR